MAITPCTQCGQRFNGEAQNLYVQHYEGDNSESYRIIACGPCAEDLLEPIRRTGLWRDDDDAWNYSDGTGEAKWRSGRRGGPSGRARRR
jgi:hypothetical protein